MRKCVLAFLLVAPLLWADGPAPPDTKEVLRLVLAAQAVKLSVHPTCHGVGSGPGDKNLGDYFAGLLAEYTQRDGQNWIEVKAEPTDRPDAWLCVVNITRRNEEEVWSWGVSFLVRKKDRKVIPGSFRCLGAG
jgi:hypothetical protein